MIALWMAYATVIGALLVVATLVVERTASGGGGQRRWISMLALVLSVAVPAWTALGRDRGVAAVVPNAQRRSRRWRCRSLPHRSRGFRAASRN